MAAGARDGAGEPVVLLHVGTPKTGTTYLQDVLWRNRRALRHSGVLYPGESPQAQFLAAMDLQGATAEEVGDPDVTGAWPRLVRQTGSWPGTTVVSHELFAPMELDRVERVFRDLGAAQLHVVCTVRDLASQIPAVWQEDLKNRHTLTFTEFLDAVTAPPGQGHWLGELFWRMQDAPAVLRRWAGGLPPQRVHVVTLPPRGAPPQQLWERFATVIGVDPLGFDASSTAPNSSLSPAEAHLLRRINLALDPNLPWQVYQRTVRRRLFDALARRPGEVTRLALPQAESEWVTQRSRRMVEELRAIGATVVGDLDELLPRACPAAAHPDDVTDADLLDAALDTVRALVEQDAATLTHPPGRPTWTATVRRRARELSERHDAVRRARAAYRSVRRAGYPQ